MVEVAVEANCVNINYNIDVVFVVDDKVDVSVVLDAEVANVAVLVAAQLEKQNVQFSHRNRALGDADRSGC